MRKKGNLFQALLIDLLVAILIFGGWPLTRYLSVLAAERQYLKEHPATEATASPAPTPTATPAPEKLETPEAETSVTPPEETPEPEELSNKTEWQKRFAEHFTEEVVQTENSYTSPNVSVTVSRGEMGEGNSKSVYFVADIYIASIDCLQSYFAHGDEYPRRTGMMPDLVSESQAVVAINGDYCGFSFGGIVLRDGNSYKDQANGFDTCVLLRDGTVECVNSNLYSADSYAEGELWQVWTFGPMLMDGEGHALAENEMNTPSYIAGVNPRTGFGYYEPGHYCFVVVDGRQSGYSNGVQMGDFAKLFESLGCTQGYNLDGGGSTMMMLGNEFVNSPSTDGQRDVPDIILIRDVAADEEEA